MYVAVHFVIRHSSRGDHAHAEVPALRNASCMRAGMVWEADWDCVTWAVSHSRLPGWPCRHGRSPGPAGGNTYSA